MNLLSHETMEMLVEVIGAVFGYIGIVIMVVWWAKSLWLLVKRWIIDHKIPMWTIRIKLGHYLVLALEFLVAKDILESIVNPSYQWLITLWVLGEVKDVFNTGSNDIYDVKDEGGKQILIPAIKEVIKSIDVKNKKIIVKLIEGLR